MKYSLLKNKETGERSILINHSGVKVSEIADPVLFAQLRKLYVNNLWRMQKDECMKSLGFEKVKSQSGKTYYE